MERVLQLFREYPIIAGLLVFLLVSLFLALFIGSMMYRSGISLKPLVFVFGFFAIVGGPQAVVHVLDALAYRREAVRNAQATPQTTGSSKQPVPWETVFGPDADPALIVDARLGLADIFQPASEAKIAFNLEGESATAARFASAIEAQQALDRYAAFFRFSEATGSDDNGWTARRFEGQGEWNHVVAAGRELYAWSGASRESVLANRVRAQGPLSQDLTVRAPKSSPANNYSKRLVSTRLSRNASVMAAFISINLLLAVGWFFKGSAWSARVTPPADTPASSVAEVRERLLAVNQSDTPVEVQVGEDGRSLEITWRYADAQWLDHMRLHKMRRIHKLVITLDEADRKARVREFWSLFDVSAGRGGASLKWQAATGMQFFQFEHKQVFGVQLDSEGKPTGELSSAYTFNLQELKAPVLETVTSSGWTWQPVMWNASDSWRWLTE